MLLIRNGNIHDAVNEKPYVADILIQDGKFAAIGEGLEIPAGAEVYDAAGLDVWPGFIDPHTHIGMFGFAGRGSKDDVEEFERCTPDNRGIDGINPNDPSFDAALSGGVTCICDGPGSVNPIAGTHLAMKTYGKRIDDMVVKNPVAMKIAFGQNAKAYLEAKLSTRMTISRVIRNMFLKAQDYRARKLAAGDDVLRRPAYDPQMEALIPVLEKKIPVKAHAHRADDIFSAIRIAREFDLDITLEHATDCGIIIDELAKENIPIAFGPFSYQPQKDENRMKNPADAVKLIEAGCAVSVMTDAPIVSENYLPILAGLLMREGLDEFNALKTITINAAKHIGVADRVGSIEVGKDADLVIAKGCPMHIAVKPQTVFVNGERAFG